MRKQQKIHMEEPLNLSDSSCRENNSDWKTAVVWLPALLLVAWMLVTANAFTLLYDGTHSYEAASRWIFKNIPHGSRILQGHWDDTLPVYIPGTAPVEYQREEPQWELGLYEPDSTTKLERLASQVSIGDYIIFPTQRLHGSLMRVPEEYPLTYRFYQLLFGGHLGYKLVFTYKKESSLFGFVFDDDLADESLSVYDHPKVTIFRNIEHLSPDEIQARINQPQRFGTLLTREQIMRIDAPAGM